MGLKLGLGLGLSRWMAAAPAGPVLGPELWPQPIFATSTGFDALGGWTVGSGLANSNAQPGFLTATALEALTAGTYRIAFTVVSNGGGDGQLQFGGVNVAFPVGVSWSPGAYSFDWVSTPVNNIIRIKDFDELGIVLSSFSAKRRLS